MSEPPPPDAAAPPRPTSPSLLTRAVRVVTAVEMTIAGVALALIFVLVLVQAGQRYLPVDGFTWTGELARFGLVWVTFAAAGVLVSRDGHIALQVVDNLPSERAVRTVRVLSLVILALVGAGYAWACRELVSDSQNLSSPALGLPMAWVYVIPLIGFASTAVRALLVAIDIALHGIDDDRRGEDLAIQVNGPSGLDDSHPEARA